MSILDSIDKIKSFDPSGMYEKIYNFPEQLIEATEIGKELEPDSSIHMAVDNIVVAGMGGSAIGGDLVRSYLCGKLKVPFHICRNYNLPEFVGKNSLVIISSYSGNTEETISAFEDALRRKSHIVCITTGGKVGEKAEEKNILTAKLPKGYPPRTALGYSFVPLLFLLSKIGFIRNATDDIRELIADMKKYRSLYAIDVETEKNPAKSLALLLHNKIPIIYTGPELTDAVGTRWKGQICENAKMLAFNNQFAEFNHNELVGWNITEKFKDKLAVIYLRDNDDHEQIKKRMDIVKEVIEHNKIEVIEIYSQGDFPLGKMFSFIQMGDFVSYYLAILNETDPTPVKVIDYLKNELEKRKEKVKTRANISLD